HFERLAEALVRAPRGDVKEVRGLARSGLAGMEGGSIDALGDDRYRARIEAQMADPLIGGEARDGSHRRRAAQPGADVLPSAPLTSQQRVRPDQRGQIVQGLDPWDRAP